MLKLNICCLYLMVVFLNLFHCLDDFCNIIFDLRNEGPMKYRSYVCLFVQNFSPEPLQGTSWFLHKVRVSFKLKNDGIKKFHSGIFGSKWAQN